MEYSILITRAAINDLNEGFEFYNDKATDLGFRFVEDVENSFNSIAQNPDAFSERYKSVRGKLLKKFPYLVLYKINSIKHNIEVLRIFNTYQNPYWS